MRILQVGDVAAKFDFLGVYFMHLNTDIKVEKVQWPMDEKRIIPGDIIIVEADIGKNEEAVDAFLDIKHRIPDTSIIFILPESTDGDLINRILKSGADECVMPQCGITHFKSIMEKHIKEIHNCVIVPSMADFGIIGNNDKIKFIINFISKVAPSDISVLIEGESGTGKELVAYGIHKASARAEEPFIPVNCGAIPKELLENEFFGHEKGAYTGAYGEKRGLFEVADKGTLFIDEIGEIDPSAQAKLLRALETGKFMRIGGDKEIKVNVRIVAATNKNVKEEMRAGRFRKDLFYRLSAIMIKLPLLKDRIDDVPMLCDYFLKHSRVLPEAACFKQINQHALDALCAYDCPGNVRELLNVIERAVVLSENRIVIPPEDLPQYIQDRETSINNVCLAPISGSEENMSLDDYMGFMEKEFIRSVMIKCGNDRIRTAESLHISVANLYRKIKKHNIS